MRQLFLPFLLFFCGSITAQDFDWVVPGVPNTPSTAIQVELTPANEPVGLLFANQSMFLTKWDKQGNEVFKIAPLSNNYVAINDFKIDASENYYITGRFEEEMVIGSDTFVSNGYGFFAAKVNSSGKVEWLYQSQELIFYAVRVLTSNEVIFLTGTTAKLISISNKSNSHSYQLEYENNRGFVKLTFGGNLLWAKFFGGSGYIINRASWNLEVNDVAIYYIFEFRGEIDLKLGLGKSIIHGQGNHNIGIVKYNSFGDFQWFKWLKDGYVDHNLTLNSIQLRLDYYGNLFLTGNAWFEKVNIDFKGGEVYLQPNTNGSYNWIAKYDSSLSLQNGFALLSKEWYVGYLAINVKNEKLVVCGRNYPGQIFNQSTTVKSTSNKRYFFALYDLDLNFQTLRFLGPDIGQATENTYFTDIKIDDHQNMYISGTLLNQAKIFDFDPSRSEAYLQDNSSESFIARYYKCKKPIEIIKNYDETTCREYISSLTALNDHYPVKWYNDNGMELYEGMNYPLPKLTGPATFIAEDGCGYRDTVEIEKQELFTILQRIYPNPASEEIKVDMFNTSSRRIYLQLINTIGKVVYENSVSSTEGMETLTIPTHNFSEGIYFLRIKDDCIIETKKILIVSP